MELLYPGLNISTRHVTIHHVHPVRSLSDISHCGMYCDTTWQHANSRALALSPAMSPIIVILNIAKAGLMFLF